MQKSLLLVMGPAIFLILYFLLPFEGSMAAMLGMAAWMLLWWITEVVSLSVTALLPIVFFPVLGILTPAELSSYYAHPLVFLFLGGFLLALGLEKINLHLRISLSILSRVGSQPRALLGGFLVSTALLSMWISNTATAVMMYPIALSVSKLLSKDTKGKAQLVLLLAVAYGANIGGIATLIGTPPNLILAGFLDQQFGYTLSFFTWMLWGVPIAAVLLLLGFLVMRLWLPKDVVHQDDTLQFIQNERTKLGSLSIDEKRFLMVFGLTIFAWMTRPLLVQYFQLTFFTDTTIALAAGVLLFVIPGKQAGEGLLIWRDTEQLPWGILLLFGGGLSLAGGFAAMGIIEAIGGFVQGLPVTHLWIWVLLVTFFGIFATELMSNLALVTVLLPLLLALSQFLGVSFLQVALPFTIASSCAFMLPMATPPNAIVFAGGKIRIKDMVLVGLVINFLALVLLVSVFGFLITSKLPVVGN
ncbi:MAG: DASS family sodium-coupled anion symporter [Schleiferiaceae bacterium]|nr:DASS family sodium-coupled anion symporter [Schleiferiaceae bacterium]